MTSGGLSVLGPVCEIPVGRGIHVDLGQESAVAVVRTPAGNVHVIDGHCPHLGARLADGTVDDDSITCAEHGWRYRLDTGARIDDAGSPICVYRTHIADGRVAVDRPLVVQS